MRRLRILKRPRNSASRHRQRRSEREKDQEDSDDRHEKPQLASRDRRDTRRRRDDGGLFVAGRPRKVHRRRPLADTNERSLRIGPDPCLCKHVAYWHFSDVQRLFRCPPLGVQQTSISRTQRSPFAPLRTSAIRLCTSPRGSGRLWYSTRREELNVARYSALRTSDCASP